MARPVRSLALHGISVVAATAMVAPLVWVIASSLRENEAIFRDTMPLTLGAFLPLGDVDLDAYIALFAERGFGRALLNTLLVAGAAIIGSLIVNGLAGFVFAKYEFRYRNALFVAVLISFMIPFEAIALPLYTMMRQTNLLDTYWALILPAIPNGVLVFMFRQFFQGVPHEIFEAAELDGAGTLSILWNVYAPLARPLLLTGGLLVFLEQWQSFMWPLLAIQSDSRKVVQVVIAELSTEDLTAWNEIFAAGVISLLIPLLVLVRLQKYYTSAYLSSGSK